MPIHADFVFRGLLGYNYLPAQRRNREELPSIFNSSTFSPEAADQLANLQQIKGAQGFDIVEYRATKFNNVSRSYSIPHPVGYAKLCVCIRNNWEEIQAFQISEMSMIRPRGHKDKRLIIMDYESFKNRGRRKRELAFGQRYTAHTDITNCFPSIYTHAIPWAVLAGC